MSKPIIKMGHTPVDYDRVAPPHVRIADIDAYLEEMRMQRATHLEELARALIKEMGLTVETISQLCIVEERGINKTTWYFQKRDNL